MNPLIYAINIGTLATWLSVAGFGVVGIAVPLAEEMTRAEVADEPFAEIEAIELTEDFDVGELPAAMETDTGTTGEAQDAEVPLLSEEALPTPPDMPDVAEFSPLPEVPDLPAPAPKKPAAAPPPRPAKPAPQRASGGSPRSTAGARGTAGRGGQGGGSGMSDARRLAGGRMPPPRYPAAARSRGQTGTVLVEFVVGENGRVVSAHAKSPSPWPLLNDAAVRCVRGWRFPPGSVTKYVRPIVFKLN